MSRPSPQPEAVTIGRERRGANRIDHLWVGVRDVEGTRHFYETIAPVVGLRIHVASRERFHVAADDRSFGLVADGRPPTENVHIAFPVPDNEKVDEFHRVALAAGYRDNAAPGERTVYHSGYYGAYVLDPDRSRTLVILRPTAFPTCVAAVTAASWQSAGSGGWVLRGLGADGASVARVGAAGRIR